MLNMCLFLCVCVLCVRACSRAHVLQVREWPGLKKNASVKRGSADSCGSIFSQTTQNIGRTDFSRVNSGNSVSEEMESIDSRHASMGQRGVAKSALLTGSHPLKQFQRGLSARSTDTSNVVELHQSEDHSSQSSKVNPRLNARSMSSGRPSLEVSPRPCRPSLSYVHGARAQLHTKSGSHPDCVEISPSLCVCTLTHVRVCMHTNV